MLLTELAPSQNGAYVRRIWDLWWRERDTFSDCILPPKLWRLSWVTRQTIPSAVSRGIGLVRSRDLVKGLESWCAQDIAERHLVDSLLKILQVRQNEFWSWHCTFRSPRLKKAQPLLGADRVTDLAVNVICRGSGADLLRKNKAVRAVIEKRYFAWPPAQDNSLLRTARERLLGGAVPRQLVEGGGATGSHSNRPRLL